MFHNNRGRILVGLLVLVVAVAAAALILAKSDPAAAQAPGRTGWGAPAPGGQVPPPPPGAVPGGMPSGVPRLLPGGAGPKSIAASESYVYVLQGSTLYQYSARTLQLANKTTVASTPTPSPLTPQ